MQISNPFQKNNQGYVSSVPILIGLNLVVFLMWKFLVPENPQFMEDNFLVSWTALEQGRYWTLITSVFSHNLLWHFLINMFVLRSFGPFLEQTLGPKFFIKFYFAAGIISSLGHCLVSNYILHSPDVPALGASGAISGLILLFALIFPKQKLAIMGIIPIPALWGALVFMAFDIWGVSAQAEGGGLPIGHGAHLGGAITGIICYFYFIRPKMVLARQHRPQHEDLT